MGTPQKKKMYYTKYETKQAVSDGETISEDNIFRQFAPEAKDLNSFSKECFTSPAKSWIDNPGIGCASVDPSGAMLSSTMPRRLGRQSISSSLRTSILFKS